jgi:two-component system, chemotaxis family, chemotaxis protein CheY
MATIMVIDDDGDVREFLRRALETAGHQVIEADDGQRGLSLFRAQPAQVVITDILMPRKEGIETIRDFRRLYPTVKIIGISGGGASGFMDFLQAALAMGADHVLHKPFRAKTLIELVDGLLTGGGPGGRAESISAK